MTKEQFLFTANTYPNQINIWYELDENSPTVIYGLTIPRFDINGNDLQQFLLEVNTITIELQDGSYGLLQLGDPISYINESFTPQVEYYFYELTTVFNIDNLEPLTNPFTNAEIVFPTPIDQYAFDASGYNATLNNVQDNRQSTYILQLGTNILSMNQDSNYSNTGWINARYEGSKATPQNYNNIDPITSGKSFNGAYYPATVTDAQIKQNASSIVYTPYLYTGEEPVPTYAPIEEVYTIPYITTITDGNYTFPISPTGSQIPLLLRSDAPSSSKVPQVGDLFTPTGSSEIIKILTVGSYEISAWTSPLYKLTVQRGYNRTTPQQITVNNPTNQNRPVDYIKASQIFVLEGNKVQGVERGKVIVQDTQEILHIDDFGYIVSGST